MSVRVNNRKESEAEFLNTAHELELMTIKLSVRENVIPKRYRYIIGQKLCDSAREVNKNIISANSIFPKRKFEFEMRRSYQLKALAALQDLLELIRTTLELFPIKETVSTEWMRLASVENKVLRKWMQSDQQRYKDLT